MFSILGRKHPFKLQIYISIALNTKSNPIWLLFSCYISSALHSIVEGFLKYYEN